MRPNESDFWAWTQEGDSMKASLNVEAVVQNAIENMMRLEDAVTRKVVVEFLRAEGYVVVEPEVLP